ncbi:hypothetical protein [Pseudomonas sp. DSV-1]|uniref:hypothetical protein n=1 Tax=Pseudomonas sp. DSV-1 TaxID=3112250 RepID=UPI002DB71E47|nr:hypothetical protein [Pseudomonas sp. DSV-1]MEC4240115.1 hypothetical protein [Pseudomonas sp. DSV-1]
MYLFCDCCALERSLVLLVSGYNTELLANSVVADEPCEAAFGLVRHCDVALVESACTVNQVLRVYLFCDRCALDRSLVLLVSGYNTELLASPVVADEPCEAAFGLVRHCDAAVVKSACTVNQALRVYLFCDRCAIERSLVLLVNCYVEGWTTNPVDAAVVKPCTGVFFYAGCNRQPNTFNMSQPSCMLALKLDLTPCSGRQEGQADQKNSA